MKKLKELTTEQTFWSGRKMLVASNREKINEIVTHINNQLPHIPINGKLVYAKLANEPFNPNDYYPVHSIEARKNRYLLVTWCNNMSAKLPSKDFLFKAIDCPGVNYDELVSEKTLNPLKNTIYIPELKKTFIIEEIVFISDITIDKRLEADIYEFHILFKNKTSYTVNNINRKKDSSKLESKEWLESIRNEFIKHIAKSDYKLEWLDINATDNPAKIINTRTNQSKQYPIGTLPWKLIKNDQEILHYIFTNFQQGFDLKEPMDKFLNEHFGIPNGDQQTVLSQFRQWYKNQANGETPEVDNPVGQIDEILKTIATIRNHIGRGNTLDIQYGLDKLVKLINKPRETDKEQPK